MKLLIVIFAVVLMAVPMAALESQVPVQVGSTILVPVTPSDDAGSTVLMIFRTDDAVRLFVEYAPGGVTVTRAAVRSGVTSDKYAVIVIHVPIAELHNVVVENAATGHRDSF